MEMLKQLMCLRCDYKWFQRTPNKPVKCPNCQSRNWSKKNFNLKAIAVLCFLALAFQGCATGRSGTQMYADGLDCVSERGYEPECQKLLDHGLAAVLRGTDDAVDFTPSVRVDVR